jgi:excisionase family DNA binding protein
MNKDTNTEIKLLDVESAAKFLTVKVSTIRSLVFQRKLPVIHIGRLVRFEKKDLIDFLQKNKTQISN